MPIACDPEMTVWISLRTDEAKPEATRPAWRCRYPSERQRQRILSAIEAATGLHGDAAASVELAAICQVCIVDCRNVVDEAGQPVGWPGALGVLTFRELVELAYAQIGATAVAEADLKKSASGSSSASASSATTN